MQPWQVFQAARKYLGAGTVACIFGRATRSAYDWAQDPAYTQHRCRSPLELLHTLFERLDACGMGYVARSAIEYLQTAIDDVDPAKIQEPLPTIVEELLEDYRCLAEFQRAIESETEIKEVQRLKRLAIDEIERTVARYAKDQEGN